MLINPYFDPNYLFIVGPAIPLAMFASWYVRHAYTKWSRVPSMSRISGAEAAKQLIRNGGLSGVSVQVIAGELGDNYDPSTKTLNLSASVAQSTSVAAIAIAAHELGHALQDAESYAPMRLRAFLVPVANIGTNAARILIMLGLVLNITGLAWLGVLAFGAGAVFSLATLPVELDASARAKRLLIDTGILRSEEEERGMKNVLNAAALTYVAALVTALAQLFYYVTLVLGMNRERD